MADAKREKTKLAPACFVIMPISDVEPYGAGHFRRVYEHLIAPACRQAGFDPLLASDVKEANMIVIDVLQRLYTAEMVLCDLSGRNPNVLFELGFRQAFNKPVVLIKDQRTERIFDISGLRDIPYDESLRIDVAHATITEIAERMKATYEAANNGSPNVNSLVQLLGVQSATVPERTPISSETKIILDAVQDLSDRVRSLEPVASSRQTIGPAVTRPIIEVQVRVQGPQESIDQLVILMHTKLNVRSLTIRSVEDVTVLEFSLRTGLTRQGIEGKIVELARTVTNLELLEVSVLE